MTSRLPLFLLALLLGHTASAELNLAGASQHTLDNGLTVLILEEQSFPLVSVQMLYRAGARDEIPGRTGLAHFLEHMAFRGSEHFPDTGLVSSIYAAGGEWHGYTWIDQTTYFATAPLAALDLLLDIEADRMARLDISAADIPAERGAVLAEMNGYENDITAVLHDASIFAALTAHPYRNNTIGWASDVRAITSEDVAAFYARHYHPGNAILAIVGAVDTDTVLKSVKERFAMLQGRAATPLPVTIEPVQQGERRVRLLRPGTRKHFQLVWHAPSAVSADYAAFLLLQELLGASSGVNFLQNDWGTPAQPGSLLHGISDDINTWFIPTAQPYVFTISGSIANDGNEAELENAIDAALVTAAEQPVGAERFAAAKQRLLDELLLDVQTTEDAAHQLAYFSGIDALDTLLSLRAHIAALEVSDVQRVAKRYLSAQQRTVAWSVDGTSPQSPHSAAPAQKVSVDRVASDSQPAPAPRVVHLDNGTPVIVQESGLSATVHLLAIVRGQYANDAATLRSDTPINGRSAFSLTTPARQQHALIEQAATALHEARPQASAAPPADDPYQRTEQIFARIAGSPQPGLADSQAVPELLVVAGQVDTSTLLDQLNNEFAANKKTTQGTNGNPATRAVSANANAAGATDAGNPLFNSQQDQRTEPGSVSTTPANRQKPGGFLHGPPAALREHIDLPLAQARTGYIVAAPGPQDPTLDAWLAALYILSHDYEGRLGKQAISRRGLVYYIDSRYRSDGTQGWITLSAGVSPDKQADFRKLLAAELERLISEPPNAQEVADALQHRTGRALSAHQSNQELADNLARQWLWHGQLKSSAELQTRLARVSRDDILRVLPDFVAGTVVEVTVRAADKQPL